MKRALLPLLLLATLAQPLWAGYGLSNVVKLGLKPAPAAEPAAEKPAAATKPASEPAPAAPAKPAAQTSIKPALAPAKPELKTPSKPQPKPVSQPAVKPAVRPQVKHAVKQPVARPKAHKPAARKPVTRPAAVAFEGYPYAVHLSSWRERALALRELERIAGRVPQAFITKIDLGPRGVWYRVDCGLCVNAAVAEARLQRIMRSGLVEKGSFVGAPMPYTIEMGQVASQGAARVRQAELKSQEVDTYLIGLGGGRYRIVCGAYPDAASAQALLDDLAALKLEARLVRR